MENTETKYCWEVGYQGHHNSASCFKHELLRETNVYVFVKSPLGERRIKKHSCGWTIYTDREEARSAYRGVLKRGIDAANRVIAHNQSELEKWGLES